MNLQNGTFEPPSGTGPQGSATNIFSEKFLQFYRTLTQFSKSKISLTFGVPVRILSANKIDASILNHIISQFYNNHGTGTPATTRTGYCTCTSTVRVSDPCTVNPHSDSYRVFMYEIIDTNWSIAKMRSLLQIMADSQKITRRKNTKRMKVITRTAAHIPVLYCPPSPSPGNRRHCVFDAFVNSY